MSQKGLRNFFLRHNLSPDEVTLDDVMPWIYTIATNTYMEFAREKKTHQDVLFDESMEYPDILDSESEYDVLEKIEIYQRCINLLNVGDRQVITLSANKSFHEIAGIIKKSYGATRQIYYRAIDKLIECKRKGLL